MKRLKINRLLLGADPFVCDDAADANDDGQQDVSDAIKVFGFLFVGDPAPPAPGTIGVRDRPDGRHADVRSDGVSVTTPPGTAQERVKYHEPLSP